MIMSLPPTPNIENIRTGNYSLIYHRKKNSNPNIGFCCIKPIVANICIVIPNVCIVIPNICIVIPNVLYNKNQYWDQKISFYFKNLYTSLFRYYTVFQTHMEYFVLIIPYSSVPYSSFSLQLILNEYSDCTRLATDLKLTLRAYLWASSSCESKKLYSAS